MVLIDYLKLAKRHWLVVVLTTLVCLGGVAAYSASQPKTYEATSRLYVTMATGTSVTDIYQGGLAAQQRVSSYAEFATSPKIAQRIIDEKGLDLTVGELQSKIKATFPPATTILDISASDSTPDGARMLADAVAGQLVRLVSEIETIIPGTPPAARASILDGAQEPSAPSGPSLTLLLAVGLAAGLVLGIAAAFVTERLNTKLRTPTELETKVNSPVLGALDFDSSPIGDVDYVRATLTKSLDPPKAVLVTSFDGNSTSDVSIKLSRALSYAGRKIALVDADFGGSGPSRTIQNENGLSLADLLQSKVSPVDALSELPESGVSLLLAGEPDSRTSDLLASDRFGEIIESLRADFDYVIVQTAGASVSADALSVSSHVDRTIGIVDLPGASLTRVQDAVAKFEHCGAPLLGLIAVNKSKRRGGNRPK